MSNKLNNKKFQKAIAGTGGNLTLIAKKCSVSRMTVHRFVNSDECSQETKDLLEHERESILDLAENKLLGHIQKGRMEAIKYALSTIGRKRGYVTKQENEHSGEIGYKFILEKPED